MVRLRRLLAGTTVLTLVLMLLGIYTAGAGAGLTCSGRWPFCDGWLGLFPANWLSFLEWFHRLVAMVTGFVILGTAALAWKRDADRRIRWALLAAVALLPLQIALGALTVTLSGLFPGGYSPPVTAAHFLTALLIFTAIAGSTALAYRSVPSKTLRRVSLLALGLFPLTYLFSFGTVFAFTPEVQAVNYGLSLTLFALVVAVVVWAPTDHRRQRVLSAVAAVLLGFQMLLGRRLLGSPDPVLVDSVAFAVFASLLGAVWMAYRADGVPLPLVGSVTR
jgi:cytochrome c oxidase assembly protein subunit 15